MKPRHQRPPRTRFRIGLLIDLLGAHGRGIFMSIADYAHIVDWSLVHQWPWGFGNFELPALGKIDGLIASCHDSETEAMVRSFNVPTVNISSFRADPIFPSVFTDSAAVGVMAAEHLLDRGLRHFGFIQANRTDWFEARRASFVERLRQAGHEPHIMVFPADAAVEARQALACEWLKGLPMPLGLAVLHGMTALEVQAACHEADLAIPEQVAMISCDDDPLVQRLAQPPLSSIRLDLEQNGMLAGRMLDDLLHDRPVPSAPIRVAPLGVVTRVSTEILAVDEPDLASALSFIRQRAAHPLTVEDVLAHVPLSRRPLEKRFKRVLGRTMLEEIHRTKVERAKQMLVDTKLSIAQVADACGIHSAARFSIIFRAVAGVSPTQYRMRS